MHFVAVALPFAIAADAVQAACQWTHRAGTPYIACDTAPVGLRPPEPIREPVPAPDVPPSPLPEAPPQPPIAGTPAAPLGPAPGSLDPNPPRSAARTTESACAQPEPASAARPARPARQSRRRFCALARKVAATRSTPPSAGAAAGAP